MNFYLTKCYYIHSSHFFAYSSAVFNEKSVHGHDYRIEVTIKNSPQDESQQVISRDYLDQIVHENLSGFNGKNLNNYFKNTSGESLANAFYQILLKTPLCNSIHRVSIQETAKNRFMS